MEEEVRMSDRAVQVPESMYSVIQQLGNQLTRYDPQTGRRRVALERALPVCMILADNDTQRAARLCEGFVDALDEWSARESAGEEQDFNGQPIP